MKDVMKMSAPGSNLGGTSTPLGGAAAGVGDGWGRGWGVLGNKVCSIASGATHSTNSSTLISSPTASKRVALTIFYQESRTSSLRPNSLQ